MITNTSLTIYHKILDENTRLEKWIRYNFNQVWLFGGKGASIDKGYDNANDVNIRIPYEQAQKDYNLDIGDVLVKGTLDFDISTEQDLSNYDRYHITSIKDNNFGNNPHIHIGGK